QTQVCAFCAPTGADAAGTQAPETARGSRQVWLDGDGGLTLDDGAGHQIGMVNGQLVNTIPGASIETPRSSELWKDTEAPTLFVPGGQEDTITLDGASLDAAGHSSVTMVGPGYDLAVDNIALQPGQKDTIVFSADGKTVKYTTGSNETPTILVGIQGKSADYSFEVKGVAVEGGGTLTLGIDTDKGSLSISTAGNKSASAYSLTMNRIDSAGEQTFRHDSVELDANSIAYLDYGAWKGDSSEISLTIDDGHDGTIDKTIPLSDQK
ncbi:MAG: hypothetical protein M3014_08395, partial [Chloroflexota bacterium]|nr:hypothetical protein [Chloroflexota bacterium]